MQIYVVVCFSVSSQVRFIQISDNVGVLAMKV